MRLLESKPEKKTRWAGGTIFSIVLHVGLIFLAVFATARAGVEKAKKDRAEKVNFVAMKKEPPPPEVKKEPPPPPKKEPPKPKAPKAKAPKPVVTPPAPRVETPAPPKGFQVVPPVVNVPTALPSIDLSKAVTNENDFSGKGVAGGTASGVEGGTGKAGDKGKEAGPTEPVLKSTPYMEFQVEKAVQHIGGAAPDYPATLRDQGVKGEVLAQFVVGENGRYESGTLKILSSSNPAFSEAVKRALPGMRFSAAQIGGQKVKQLVQMPFQFNLKT
jgi:protein TonB